MDKEMNEDARTKQDLLYECNSLESRLSNEIVKNEHLEQQCKKQKEAIDKLKDLLIIKKARCLNEDNYVLNVPDLDDILQVLKEVE